MVLLCKRIPTPMHLSYAYGPPLLEGDSLTSAALSAGLHDTNSPGKIQPLSYLIVSTHWEYLVNPLTRT